MPALIAFRALQGLGAGAVQPMAVTIAGDIYTIAERARVQGYLASVWAISVAVGPTLGGFFSQFLSWRWIFYVNVPLCILAAWMLLRTFHETVEHREHKVDYLGATLLTVSLSLLSLAVLEGGQAWDWNAPQSIGAFGIGAAVLVGFVLAERHAAEPVLPLWVLSRRLLLTTALLSLGVGALLIGLTSYVPTCLEGVLHVTPFLAGLTLAVLTIGWPIASTLAGRLDPGRAALPAHRIPEHRTHRHGDRGDRHRDACRIRLRAQHHRCGPLLPRCWARAWSCFRPRPYRRGSHRYAPAARGARHG